VVEVVVAQRQHRQQVVARRRHRKQVVEVVVARRQHRKQVVEVVVARRQHREQVVEVVVELLLARRRQSQPQPQHRSLRPVEFMCTQALRATAQEATTSTGLMPTQEKIHGHTLHMVPLIKTARQSSNLQWIMEQPPLFRASPSSSTILGEEWWLVEFCPK
jgi:hypothetical protein